MYQVFADDMRQRIEAKTKEIFKSLIWKDSHFQDICLGPDYRLEVIDRYGLPARPELSAGERQVLSLSFITAMSRVSEEEAPLVMDTPFGRLSSHHRNSITEHLPELADQLVLFVTDEELRDQARQNLEPRIGTEYRLEFDRETSCTEIVEVG
jgi:DNA sulfur modification protein DndD